MRGKSLLGILLGIVLVLTLFAGVAYAIALPDSTPTVVNFYVYRNLLETNDYCLIIYANTPYGTPPSVPFTQAFNWSLLGADNTTVVGNTIGFAYNKSGYGYNVFSMYFDNTTAPAWGGTYQVRLTGNPSVFTPPPIYNYQLAVTDYTTETTTAMNQAALADIVLLLAQQLNVNWGLLTAYYLTVEVETGTKLSAYGELFFRGAIYGLQGLAPAVFSYIVGDVETGANRFSTSTDNYSDNLTTQWATSWIQGTKDAASDLLGTGYDLPGIIGTAVIAAGVIVGASMIVSDFWAGLVLASAVLVVSTRLSFFPFAGLGLGAALAQVFFWMRFWKPFGG